jgi:hypothetical protein
MDFSWDVVPDSVLLSIFSYLSAQDLAACGMVCWRWRGASQSQRLWKRLLRSDYQLEFYSHNQRPCYKEYRRLAQLGTVRNVKILSEHEDEVWHVIFSNDGTLLAAGGKEGCIVVWNVTDTEKISRQWRLDVHDHGAAEVCFFEFSSNDELLLVSAGISRQNLLGAVIICDARLGTTQLMVLNVYFNFFACWLNTQWFVTGYFEEIIGGPFAISLLSIENIRETTTDLYQNINTYPHKINVIKLVFYLHNIFQLQHCKVVHNGPNNILICQISMSSVDYFASVAIRNDENGRPSLVNSQQDPDPRKQFDYIVPLDGHINGMVLSCDSSKIIASVNHKGPPLTVEVCIYDVVTLHLLHRLPSDNMANPQSFYYQFPAISQERIAW